MNYLCKVKQQPAVIAFSLLFLLVSCDASHNDFNVVSGSTEIQSLQLSSANLTITEVNSELSLSVSAIDADGKKINLSEGVVWQSSNEFVATVNNEGLVTVQGLGKVTLSASYRGVSDSIVINVNNTIQPIQGKLRYEDKKYDASGFIGGFLPVFNDIRYVTVDLLDVNGEILESTMSDSRGLFQFGHIIPEQYSIRVLAEVSEAPAAGFSVKDLNGRIYAVTKTYTTSEINHDIKISNRMIAAGAFNMLDVFISGAESSRESYQVNASGLSVFWEPNEGVGSYYCSAFDRVNCKQGRGVYVLNHPEDSDEYDDDVLLHEFGHFIMETYFVDDSPGGCHAITDNDLDLRVAWSEGWATFFGSSVKSYIQRTAINKLSSRADVTSYVDTDGKKDAFLSYDILEPPLGMDENATAENFYYASSEFAVSNLLWKIAGNYGGQKILDVLANHFPESTIPTNLASFWQGLLLSDTLVDGEIEGMTEIFAERKVFYQQDVFENDDDVASANLVQVAGTDAVDHYLYKDDLSADVDMFAFDVESGNSYAVTTSKLRNGIDTYLRILDQNGDIVVIDNKSLENDDADPNAYYRADPACYDERRFFNSASALASRVEFTASVSARYFVEVSHILMRDKFSAQNALNATGPYGTYRLKVE